MNAIDALQSAARALSSESTNLVDLDVPLAVLLPLLELVRPDEALVGGHLLEHLGDAGHHALQAAEVHLAAVLVGLLAGERVVDTEVVRVRLEDRLPLVIVQECVRVGDAEEEPGEARVNLAEGGLL